VPPAQLHIAATATAIPSAVLGTNPAVLRRVGCVWGSGLARGPLGAPGERQDEERGYLPAHLFPPHRPTRWACAAPPTGPIRRPICCRRHTGSSSIPP